MGVLASCCNKQNNFPADERANLRNGGRIRVVRNETEDPRAPLLTKKNGPDPSSSKDMSFLSNIEPDKDLFDFVENLSTDDGEIPDDEEIDELLNEKQD